MSPGPDVEVDAAARLEAVRHRIAAAEAAAGHPPGRVRLVGASKTVPVERLVPYLAAGLADLGENRAQELRDKAGDGRLAGARWHFLGAVQRNKVPWLAPQVALWHAVDRVEVGATIARHAAGARVLVQVALAPEPTKAGVEPGAVPRLVDDLRAAGLDVVGLMAVPPRDDEPRHWYARLAALGRELGLAELSMGMSDDLEATVAEGATWVRVGRALFGPRPGPADVRR